MQKLNQVIAVEKGTKTRVEKFVTELYHAAQKPELFNGLTRTYQPLQDDGEAFPPETKFVQQTVAKTLQETARALTELFDTTATKDWANCAARADVLVDGRALLTNVPVTYLLFLEKQLTDLHTIVSKLPTLDPSEQWINDPNTGNYKTSPVETVKTKKINKAFELTKATEKHPAQVQLVQEDVTIGHWTTIKVSGAMPVPQRDKLISRITKLQVAVKYAREEANAVNADQQSVGETVFGWLFNS